MRNCTSAPRFVASPRGFQKWRNVFPESFTFCKSKRKIKQKVFALNLSSFLVRKQSVLFLSPWFLTQRVLILFEILSGYTCVVFGGGLKSLLTKKILNTFIPSLDAASTAAVVTDVNDCFFFLCLFRSGKWLIASEKTSLLFFMKKSCPLQKTAVRKLRDHCSD